MNCYVLEKAITFVSHPFVVIYGNKICLIYRHELLIIKYI